jgi:hypothetical protein
MKNNLTAVFASAFFLLLGLNSGYLIGRNYPAHHYVQWGPRLLDESTGRVCNPFPPSSVDAKLNGSSGNDVIDQAFAAQAKQAIPQCQVE